MTVKQTPGTTVKLTAFADSQREPVELPQTKVDARIGASLITRKHASDSKGTLHSAPAPITVQDAAGQSYTATQRVTLRCCVYGSARSFGEDFYVVDDLGDADAIMRCRKQEEPGIR